MRPTPTARHLTAAAIFLAVSVLFGYLAMHETRISDRQAHLATAALKEHDGALFTHDPVYGRSGLWQVDLPIFQSLLKLSLVPSGYRDVVLPFRLMTGIVALVYLCGMYALLFQQCRSWSVSAFVAVGSAAVFEAIPGLKWGFGSLATTEPETLCLAVLPMILLAYLRYEHQVRVIWVFAAIGMLGNLDLSVAMNLTLVLSGVYLVRHHFTWRAVGTAALGAMAALLAAMPTLSYVVWLRATMSGAGGADYDLAQAALATFDPDLLYPRVLTKLLNWHVLVMLTVLGIPSILVLVRVERFRVRHQSVWVWLMILAIVVGFGFHGLSQAVGKVLDRPPPILEFFSALKLVMVPLFVLAAQALTNVFRLAPRQRALLQSVGLVAIVAWLAPSENLRVARYSIWETGTSFLEEARKPTSVLRHRRRAARHKEREAVAAWARTRSKGDAVFLTDDIVFRMASRRSILVSDKDMWYYYYLAPTQLPRWNQRVQGQAALLNWPAGRADPDMIAKTIEALSDQGDFETVSEWYVLLEHESHLDSAGGLTPIESEGWGTYYRLFRVR